MLASSVALRTSHICK